MKTQPTKRILSLLLSVVMVLGMVTVPAFADAAANTITAYITISKHGEIVTDKNGDTVALAPVELAGQESYTLDDLFKAAHDLLYDGGAATGYASSEGKYGLAVDKLWGDESTFFGYQVNGGTESVWGPTHQVENGDFVDAVIYKNEYPDTEAYTKFDKFTADAYAGQSVELTLSKAGYDENWNTVFSGCAGAALTVNGALTETVTDADGKAVLIFEKAGTYVVSASQTKTVSEQTVPAITAPVCVVTVDGELSEGVLHNIAAKYSQNGLCDEGNMVWFVADLAVYNELYPQSASVLSDDEKQACLDEIIESADEATKPGDLAKYIIALRALGYDARDVYTKKLKKLDVVSKLTALVDAQDAGVTNVYTLPYVIIALQQGADYATDEQMNYLINSAVSSKTSWQDTTWGVDGAAPMLRALAPYYSTNPDVAAVIDETVELIVPLQGDDGSLGNAASSGLALVGLSALGIDAQTVTSNGYSLIDGILAQATDDFSGFEPTENSFSTEQGFRGLLSYWLFKQGANGKMFDFASYPTNTAYATQEPKYCPVTFEVKPLGATVRLDGETPADDGIYYLADGTYDYTIVKSGYTTVSASFTVTADEALNHTPKTVAVTLKRDYSSGDSSSSGAPMVTYYTVKFETNQGSAIDSLRVVENSAVRVPDAPEKEGYVFDGWYTDSELTQAYDFNSKVTKDIILYAKWLEVVEQEWENPFADVGVDAWYYDGVKYVHENNIMQGTDKGFEPDANLTRAQFTAVIVRALALQAEPAQVFDDVNSGDWFYEYVNAAYQHKIVNGVSETSFNPNGIITREEVAVMLARASALCGNNTDIDDVSARDILAQFSDYINISDWAFSSVAYCVEVGVFNSTQMEICPKDEVTRAQIAQIFYNIGTKAVLQ